MSAATALTFGSNPKQLRLVTESPIRFAASAPVVSLPVAMSDQVSFANPQTNPPSDPPLSKAQRFCDWMIAQYQKITRENPTVARFSEKTGLFKCAYKEKKLSDYSCSEYTREAIRRHGVIKGIAKGFLRILMCNPLTFRSKRLQAYCVEP